MAQTSPRVTPLIQGQLLEVDPTIYRLLVDSITEYAIFLLDPRGQIASWNSGAEKIKGYISTEVLGKHFSIFYPPEDVQNGKCDRVLQQALETGRYEESGIRVCKGGRRIWANVIVHRLDDSQGRLVGFSKITKDLSELKKAETKIEELSKFNAALFEYSPSGMFVFDPDGQCQHVNPAGLTLSSFSRDFVLKSNFRRLPHWKDAGLVGAADQALNAPKNVRVDAELTSLAGKPLSIAGTFIPFTISGKRRLLWQVMDGSELKRARELLIQTAKLASLGKVAGGIAHEVNNPLSVIQLSAERLSQLASEVKPDLAKIKQSAATIVATVDRAVTIMKSIRAYARDGQNDAFERTFVLDLIQSTVDLCLRRFQTSGVELRMGEIDPGLAIDCRKVEISQVLLNLFSNALDAVENAQGPFVHLEVRSEAPDFIEISVTDSGSGIPEEIAKKLMEPFFTTKAAGKGTGLGLSLSKKIVAAHRGELRLDSQCKNTCFVIRLPRVQSTH